MQKIITFFSFLACITSFSVAQKPDTLLFQVYFAPAKATLDETAQHDLKMACLLAADASRCKIDLKTTVENAGSEAKTVSLYTKRTETVKQQLVALGINAAYITIDSSQKALGWKEENVKNKRDNRRTDIWMIRYYDAVKPTKAAENTPPPLNKEKEANTPKKEEAAQPKTEEKKEVKNEPKPAPTATTPAAPAKKEEPLEIVSEIIAPNKQTLQSILTDMRKDKKQSFKFSSEKNATITLKSGAVIYIPANAFELEGAANGTIELWVEEYARKSDMALASIRNLSNGKLLESGGTYYLKAFIGGKEIGLKEKVKLHLSVPNTKKNLNLFETFTAKANSNGQDWEQVSTSASVDFEQMCNYPLPDSIEKKLKIKSDDFCKACGNGIGSHKPNEKQKDKILQKYAVASCDAMSEQLQNELSKRNLGAWKQEAIATKLYEDKFDFGEKVYFFEKVKLGWVNTNRYLDANGALMQINTEPFSENQDNIAFIALKKENTLVPLNTKLPQGTEIFVVGIKQNSNEIKVSIVETKVDSNLKKWGWEKVTKDALKTSLGKLDTK